LVEALVPGEEKPAGVVKRGKVLAKAVMFVPVLKEGKLRFIGLFPSEEEDLRQKKFLVS
jgi:hypothetical protein